MLSWILLIVDAAAARGARPFCVLTLADPGYEFWYRFANGTDRGMDHPVLSRWARVRGLRAAEPDSVPTKATSESPLAKRCDRTSKLRSQGCDLVKMAAEDLRRRGCALVLTDADGVIVASHGADVLAGGLRDDFREGVRWDERARGTNAIGTALAENTPVTVIGRAHYDRSSHGLVCYAAPIHDATGKLIAALDVSGPVSAADPLLGITVQSLAAAIEGALRAQAADELSGQLRLNETFVATVSHDLRTPLTAILTGADLMLARSEDSSPRLVAERIRSSGRRMFRMVDQLSDLTRARLGGGIRLALGEAIDLVAVTERVVGELRVAHSERRIDVVPAGDAHGHWDAARLEQVVSNLVANALRHGVRSEPIHVRIDGSRTDRVFLGVTNGGEIDASVLPHLFEPFHSSKAIREPREGLGLGLYIVEQIVRAHQGQIEVLTRRGSTTFCVALPRKV
jgi:signal transduction histidine kinase